MTESPRDDVFISYAQEDQAFAFQIQHFLENVGLRCWIAGIKLRGGQEWPKQIHTAIRRSAAVVVVLSEHTNTSDWVGLEVHCAIEYHKKVIPVKLDDHPISQELNFYLGKRQRIEAFSQPPTAYRTAIVDAVKPACELVRQSEPEPSVEALKSGEVAPSEEAQRALEVIGFDLGDGETAVSKVSVYSHDDPTPIPLQGKYSQLTALGYHPKRGLVVGDEAILDHDVDASILSFKQPPGTGYLNGAILADYLGACYRMLLNNGQIIGGTSSYFLIGCPSGWSTKDMKHYEQILNRSGIPRLTVVRESRAALLNLIKAGSRTEADGLSTALLIDVGSSTTDFTIVVGTSEAPIDFGQVLGSGAIEKEMLSYLIETDPQGMQLENALNADPVIRYRCELLCRRVKEEYFSNESNYRKSERTVPCTAEVVREGVIFCPRVSAVVMDEVLSRPIGTLGGLSWKEAFRDLLIRVRGRLQRQAISPEAVAVTGGGSKMSFVQEACQQVFPEAAFERDSVPEVSIASGLARWGRRYLLTADFEAEFKELAQRQLPALVAGIAPSVSAQLASRLCNRLLDEVVRPVLVSWRSGAISSLDQVGSAMQAEVERWRNKPESLAFLAASIKEFFAPAIDKLSKMTRALCRKYDIPAQSLDIDVEFHGLRMPEIDCSQWVSATGSRLNAMLFIAGGVCLAPLAFLFPPSGFSSFALMAKGVADLWNASEKSAREGNMWTVARKAAVPESGFEQALESIRPGVEQALRKELEAGRDVGEMVSSIGAQLLRVLQERADQTRNLIRQRDNVDSPVRALSQGA